METPQDELTDREKSIQARAFGDGWRAGYEYGLREGKKDMSEMGVIDAFRNGQLSILQRGALESPTYSSYRCGEASMRNLCEQIARACGAGQSPIAHEIADMIRAVDPGLQFRPNSCGGSDGRA